MSGKQWFNAKWRSSRHGYVLLLGCHIHKPGTLSILSVIFTGVLYWRCWNSDAVLDCSHHQCWGLASCWCRSWSDIPFDVDSDPDTDPDPTPSFTRIGKEEKNSCLLFTAVRFIIFKSLQSILNIFWKKYSFALLLVDMDTNPETVPDPDRQALDSTPAKCIQIHNTPYHMPIMLSSYVPNRWCTGITYS